MPRWFPAYIIREGSLEEAGEKVRVDALKANEKFSVEEYLKLEADSAVKHEFIAGAVYAMGGGRNVHQLIATNATVALASALRGRPCRAYNSDTKIRIRLPGQVRFYYPDASVICRENSQRDTFQDEPVLVVEVLSSSTRRIDLSEKKDAYLSIPSLCLYLACETEICSVTAWRRTEDGFVQECWQQIESKIPLPELGIHLNLADVYDGVNFSPLTETE